MNGMHFSSFGFSLKKIDEEMSFPTDLEIAQQCQMNHINVIAEK